MRIVVDTNVIVSDLYSPDSPPGRVLRAGALGRIELCAPETVRAELVRVLGEVLDLTSEAAAAIIERLPIEWLEEAIYSVSLKEARKAIPDPDDAPVLACALALGVDLVSGDKDLHAAKVKHVKVWKLADL